MPNQQTVTNDFGFHGEQLDRIFDDYEVMLDSQPVGYSNRYGGFWYITKSDDIFDAEQDPETWAVGPSMLLPSFGTDSPLIPIDIDPPAHAAYRKILLPMFTPMAISKLEPGMHDTAQQLADQVMEAVDEDGVFDASSLFSRPMPTIIFSRIAGYPEEDWPQFDRWVDEIIYDRTEYPERAKAAGDELYAYMAKLIAVRRDDPESHDDIMNQLLNARVDGRELSHDELLSYGYLLFVAGLDTTAWAIRASIWFLAQNPDAQRKLRQDPKLIPNAAEEFLRTLSPVQAMARTALKDTEVQGQEIKAGDRAVLVFGAGNRDPEVYPNPNEIDIERENNRHLAFGGGIHRCLGSNLGRKELVIALEHFLSTVPDFELAGDSPWHGVGPLPIRVKKGN